MMLNPSMLMLDANDINSEVTKSFKNINYSQWERQQPKPKSDKPDSKSNKTIRSANAKQPVRSIQNGNSIIENKYKPLGSTSTFLIQNRSTNSLSPTAAANKTIENSAPVPVAKHVFKTKRQLQEEENRKAILRVKIQFAKEYLESLNKREQELLDENKQIIKVVEKKEKASNVEVDGILRKYEKYQNVKKTIKKKHYDEIEQLENEIKQIKNKTDLELTKHKESSNEIELKLNEAQETLRQLSLYKNQEYPEKQLQIETLRKKLKDMNDIHNEEYSNLTDLLAYERNLTMESKLEQTKKVAEKVSNKAIVQMHESLKDMASYNNSMKNEIEFYKSLINNLNDEIQVTQIEVNNLKRQPNRYVKNVAFDDVLNVKYKEICTPDMDVVLNLTENASLN